MACPLPKLPLFPNVEVPAGMAPMIRRFPSRPESLGAVRQFISQLASATGLSEVRQADLVLAVCEASSNAVRHAGGVDFSVSWEATPGSVVIEVEDLGVFVPRPDPADGPAEVTGGFGFPLMLALCDEVGVRRGTAAMPGTRVRLSWARPAGSGGEVAGGEAAGPPGAPDARLAFLARASPVLLETSVDHRRVLQRVLDLVVPELTDYATLREVGEGGRLGLPVVRHTDPAKVELVRKLEAYQRGAVPAPIAEALATGRSRLSPEISRSALRAAARDAEHLRLLEELSPCSSIIVPIRGRGEVVAVLSLTNGESGRRFTPADLLLVEELSSRAGLAIDNARLYDAEHQSRLDAEAARRDTEAARSSLSLLLEASSALSGSLDSEEGFVRLARLAARRLCDVCLVDVLDAAGAPRRLAAEVADPALAGLAEVLRRHPPKPGGRHPAVAVLASGVSSYSPAMPPGFMEATTDGAEHLEVTRALDFHSYMCVPVAARGRVLGTLTLVATGYSGRHYTAADLTLAEDLARRAGLMLDNARLFEERARIAAILQQSLLPPELPRVLGAEVASRYLPAVGDIGGDFYDVFPLDRRRGRRRWLLAVGDVCGKGPEAAWLTSMVRYTLRAAAMQEATPSRMLRVVNDAVLRQAPTYQFCTMACAVLELGGGPAGLTLALAGHPHPLLRSAGGTVRTLGSDGDLLGVLPDAAHVDREVILNPGDTVVFLTDGALDPQAQPAEDNAALARALARDGAGPAEQTARALEAAVLGPRSRGYLDDVLLLVLKIAGDA